MTCRGSEFHSCIPLYITIQLIEFVLTVGNIKFPFVACLIGSSCLPELKDNFLNITNATFVTEIFPMSTRVVYANTKRSDNYCMQIQQLLANGMDLHLYSTFLIFQPLEAFTLHVTLNIHTHNAAQC